MKGLLRTIIVTTAMTSAIVITVPIATTNAATKENQVTKIPRSLRGNWYEKPSIDFGLARYKLTATSFYDFQMGYFNKHRKFIQTATEFPYSVNKKTKITKKVKRRYPQLTVSEKRDKHGWWHFVERHNGSTANSLKIKRVKKGKQYILEMKDEYGVTKALFEKNLTGKYYLYGKKAYLDGISKL